MSRLEQIQALLAQTPQDTFLRYALAMEFRSQGQSDAAVETFQTLMQQVPPYVPAYFMCGQALAETGQVDRARAVLREGIERARSQGDLHAAGEMSEFLAELGQFGET